MVAQKFSFSRRQILNFLAGSALLSTSTPAADRRTLAQADCFYWLPSGFSPPKYWLGQTVKVEWPQDEPREPNFGSTLWQQGFIVGLCFNNPELREKGWSYHVKWLFDFQGVYSCPNDSVSLEPESELIFVADTESF